MQSVVMPKGHKPCTCRGVVRAICRFFEPKRWLVGKALGNLSLDSLTGDFI